MKKWFKNLFKSKKQKRAEEARTKYLEAVKRDETGRWIMDNDKSKQKPATLPLEDRWSQAKGRIDKTSPHKPADITPAPKKPTPQKPVAKQVEKKEAIKKDLADTPLTNKPAPKKFVQKKDPKKD